MESNNLQATQFYVNPWGRESSSEIPRTVAFSETPRLSPWVTTAMEEDIEMKSLDATLPDRPASSSGLDVLGKDVKKLMDAIQSLRHLGFEKSVIPLPKIVVVGDQSTGKSSVIEGISGIQVPRNAGTCTRCPLEINLSHNEQSWRCKVYLTKKYFSDKKLKHVSRNSPLGPWHELQQQEDHLFASLRRREEVSEALHRAQLATLNPGTDFNLFRPEIPREDLPPGIQYEFSPNIIRLDISGPDLPNLAFFDLPGMISHIADNDQVGQPKLIENLARCYTESPNSIILMTLTMNHDIQNSKTAGFIHKMGFDDRTLGVFTKPDLMSPDCEDMFYRIIANRDVKDFKRKLGYFVVKNNHNPKIGHSIARREEAQFFEDWSRSYKKLGQFQHKFSTSNLQQELSKLLAEQIRVCVPIIRKVVEEKIERYEEELSQLPKPPAGNFQLELNHTIVNLQRLLHNLLKQNNSSDFMALMGKSTQEFRQALTKGSQPRLDRAIGSLEATSRDVNSPLPSRPTVEAIEIEDDDDEEVHPATPVHVQTQRKRPLPQDSSHSIKRPRTDGSPANSFSRDAKVFSLDEIREIINSKDDTGLLGSTNPAATKAMFLLSTSNWGQLTNKYIQQGANQLGKAIINCTAKAFRQQKETALYEAVEKVVKTHVLGLFHEFNNFAMRCLQLESTVFTLDRAAIDTSRKKLLEDMLADRREERARELMDEEEARGKVINPTTRSQRISLARLDKGSKQDEEQYRSEIEQLATVRAYYVYAATRFTEYVVLFYRQFILPKCGDTICDLIISELRLHDDSDDATEYVRGLLEVSPEVAQDRKRIEDQLARLKSGLERLRELEGGTERSMSETASSSLSTP